MELNPNKKYYFKPLSRPCGIASITTQAGGVSGDKNMFVTIEFTDGAGDVGDCRTFPLGLASRYLRELRPPSRVQDTDVEKTDGEFAETK